MKKRSMFGDVLDAVILATVMCFASASLGAGVARLRRDFV